MYLSFPDPFLFSRLLLGADARRPPRARPCVRVMTSSTHPLGVGCPSPEPPHLRSPNLATFHPHLRDPTPRDDATSSFSSPLLSPPTHLYTMRHASSRSSRPGAHEEIPFSFEGLASILKGVDVQMPSVPLWSKGLFSFATLNSIC